MDVVKLPLEVGLVSFYDIEDDHGEVIVYSGMKISSGMKRTLIDMGITEIQALVTRPSEMPQEQENSAIGFVLSESTMNVTEDRFNEGLQASLDRILTSNKYHGDIKIKIRNILINEFKKDTYRHLLHSLLQSIDVLFVHSINVTILTMVIGHALGESIEKISECAVGSMFHDYGMTTISNRILEKSEGLSDVEYELIKGHTHRGLDTISGLSLSSDAEDIILNHHERLDGSGYPNGLKGDELSLWSRISGIADSYEAMIGERPYRKSMDSFDAIKELLTQPHLYDIDIVKKFMMFLGYYPLGTMVRLSDNVVGKVIWNTVMNPTIRVLKDASGEDVTTYRTVDIKYNGDVEIADIVL